MEPEMKKQFLFWFVFVLFLLYILIWLIILFGLPPSILEMMFSFPSGISKYLFFGKKELDEINKAKDDVNDR